MVSFKGIGGNDGFNPVGPSGNKFLKKVTTHFAKPIDMVGEVDNKFNQIDRTDLDKISPYASMGVNFSQKAPAGSPESYMDAAPELASWSGNFTISEGGKKDALSYLSALNKAVKDYGDVAPHLQDKTSPFAELFANT